MEVVTQEEVGVGTFTGSSSVVFEDPLGVRTGP